MAKNLSLGAILGIVIVTALIVSIATVSITGNVIKVRPSSFGKEVYKTNEVYNKTEIDGKINDINRNEVYNKTEIDEKFFDVGKIIDTQLHMITEHYLLFLMIMEQVTLTSESPTKKMTIGKNSFIYY